MRRYIAEGLWEYLSKDMKPWHMPGHKRKNLISESVVFKEAEVDAEAICGKGVSDITSIDEILNEAMSIDVTEVPGTDDLHHPEAMILNSMKELAKVYGTFASYYLVNGSTCGIMAAISACCGREAATENGVAAKSVAGEGQRVGNYDIIVARNCHKSVYNIVELLGLKPVYITPAKLQNIQNERLNNEFTGENKSADIRDENKLSDMCTGSKLPDIYGGINPGKVAELISQNPGIKAVVITSPTYEGVVSDVAQIKKILMPYNIPLIVDEAHGAHLPFVKELPDSAISCGADIVVQSLHKTLPALTQTAILHVNNSALNDRVKKYLSVFMSSSPSYIMLCSMEGAIAYALEKNHMEYLTGIRDFCNKVEELKYIKHLKKEDILSVNGYDYDETRLVLYLNKDLSITGEEFAQLLRSLGCIEVEMTGIDYIVLISTLMDERIDFEHLYNTLLQIDNMIEQIAEHENQNKSLLTGDNIMDLYNLVGKKAVDNIYVYPPGSYILAVGEVITEEIIDKIIEYIKAGKKIHGTLS